MQGMFLYRPALPEALLPAKPQVYCCSSPAQPPRGLVRMTNSQSIAHHAHGGPKMGQSWAERNPSSGSKR